MIRSIEWITDAASRIGVHDVALVEKTIRAFSLLEALARSGCPFIFKGGSSLMLHMNTSKRLSIDIDIILFQDGISRIGNFIHSERYNLDSAIVNASKAAYLSRLLDCGINEVRHYSPDGLSELADQVIQQPLPTKLNKLKKTHPEAFFYWIETFKTL